MKTWEQHPWSAGRKLSHRLRQYLRRTTTSSSTGRLFSRGLVDRFGDFFWNSREDLDFSPTNTDLWYERIPVYYLHGALFIHQLPDGKTVKARGTERPGDPWGTYTPLLHVDFDYRDSEFPLFVTEGNANQKAQAISRSDYLNFAYQQFAAFDGPLVAYGQRLGSRDQHLVDAIRSWVKRAGKYHRVEVAISVYSQDPDEILVEKQRIAESLEGATVCWKSKPSNQRIVVTSAWRIFAMFSVAFE